VAGKTIVLGVTFQEYPIPSRVELIARQPRKNLLVIVATMREARLHERERSGFLLQCTTDVLMTLPFHLGIESCFGDGKGVAHAGQNARRSQSVPSTRAQLRATCPKISIPTSKGTLR
jgi:hypothetical protein